MLLKEISSGSDGIILFWFILFPLLICLGVLMALRKDFFFESSSGRFILFMLVVEVIIMIGFLPTLLYAILIALLAIFFEEKKIKEQKTEPKLPSFYTIREVPEDPCDPNSPLVEKIVLMSGEDILNGK